MVSEAQRTRAPIQRLTDIVSSWFVPTVVLVAIRHVRRLGPGGARAANDLRARQRAGRAHHRVPMRARTGYSDVDHGSHRPGWHLSS